MCYNELGFEEEREDFMSYKSFESIAHEMLTNQKFLRLAHESHHGITRVDHSLNVARKVYK